MKNLEKIKREKRIRRHKRKRARISGDAIRPRLSVFRSNNHIYCQLINDKKGQTLFSASDLEIKTQKKKTQKKEKESSGRNDMAFLVGKLIAKKATEKKIKKVVFDSGGYKYHGRVKKLAEGAREGGLIF